MHKHKWVYLSGSLFAGVTLAGAAFAQDAVAPDEIVVTATKRSESLQSVGLSITAMSGDDLAAKGVASFADYGDSIPNLSYGATGDGSLGSRGIAIRGIQGAGATGFYIDDTPVPDSLDPQIVDLERIEVLRGPQGTLYGARSMGGTVRLITRQPDFSGVSGSLRGGLSFTKEGGVNYLTDGSLNLPVVNDLIAVSIQGFYSDETGVFDKRVTGGGGSSLTKNVDDRRAYGGQIAVRIQPSDALTVTPRIWYQRTEQDGFPFADVSPGNFVQERAFDIDEGGYDEWTLYSLTGNYVTDFGTFTSSTSYFDRKTPETEDYTAFVQAIFELAEPLPAQIDRNLRLKRFVQELRFSSDFSGPFQIVAGVFYSSSRDYNDYLPASVVDGLDDALGAGGTLGDLAFTTTRHLRTKERAVFGEASLDLVEGLTATVGLRYFSNSQRYRERGDGIISGGPVSIDRDKTTENGVTPKFLIEYQANRDFLVYASAAKGYRVGGFNGDISPTCDADLDAIGTTRDQTLSYKSDSLWNYEVGTKASLFDRKLTANVAAFRIDWSNIQQNVLLPCGFPFIGNSGKARSTGFEVELNARPVQDLRIGLAIGYADAKIVQAGAGTPQLAGSPVYQVPEWTIATNAEYSVPVTTDFEGFLRGDYSFTDASYSANNDPLNPRKRPSYSLVDIRAGVRNETFEVAVYAKNLTDEHANLADNRSLAAEAPGLPRIVTNRPRTIGLEARYRF